MALRCWTSILETNGSLRQKTWHLCAVLEFWWHDLSLSPWSTAAQLAGAGPAVPPMKKIVWNVREWQSCDSLEFTLLKTNIPALAFSVISNKLLSTCSQHFGRKLLLWHFTLAQLCFLKFWKIDLECVNTSGDQLTRLSSVPHPSVWRCLWTGLGFNR